MSDPHKSLGIAALVAASITISCTEPTPVGPPSVLQRVTASSFTTVAGAAIAGGVTVKVVDANGRSVSGSRVTFAVTRGDGDVAPHIILSDGEGLAHAEWTVGQTAGENELLASIEGVDSTATFTATGTPGPATTVRVTPRTLRIPSGTTSATVTAAVVDQYGNPTGAATTYTSVNPTLVTVNATTGAVSVVGNGGTTFIIATGAGFGDTSRVIVLTSSDKPCTGITNRATLTVGQVITTGFFDNGICVDGGTAGSEYALVPYFNSSVPSALTSLTLSAFGNSVPAALGNVSPAGAPIITLADERALEAGAAFHNRLRAREEQGMASAAPDARLAFENERKAHRAFRTAAVPRVGDQMELNVNPNDFCSNPRMRTGRVVAVTQRAVVVADVSNPPDGFTDAEYLGFGVNFDTLVYSLDVANFGAPTDIDANGGRVVLFFTSAVKDAGTGVLGYYYGRDLLPKSGPLGSCPGSNVSEILYLLVPDATISKAFVAANTVGTAAHELQHLINASRRLYVNTSSIPTEERWLNEGLSHVAEELMFYRASGLGPRQNIGQQLFTSQYLSAYLNFQFNNLARLREYLRSTSSQSVIGTSDGDDDFATRGAIWSYLRYAADQRFSADEKGFWFKLVNSNVTGLQNLYEVVGADARLLMRDWTLVILLDDLVPAVDPKYQDRSWNLRAAISDYQFSSVFSAPLLPTAGSATQFRLSAGGTLFARFGVSANQEAYVRAAGTQATTALSKNVLLALVRTK